jgi:hypothetical protein
MLMLTVGPWATQEIVASMLVSWLCDEVDLSKLADSTSDEEML